MACIFCDKPCVFFRNAKRLSNIPPCGGNRRGFGCIYAGHFSPCPHVRLRLQRTHCFIPRWAASTARVYTRKTPTHLICKDMHGVFRLMFLPNHPSARAKSKIFSAGYIITRNLSCKVFLSLPRFCRYSHTKFPIKVIHTTAAAFAGRDCQSELHNLISYFFFPDVLVRHRG